MSQGSKEPLVQLCPAFQVQSSPICMASYGAAPGGGGGWGGCHWVGKPQVQQRALLRARVCWGWSLNGWPAAWLALARARGGRGESLLARTGNFGSRKASPSPQGTVPKTPPSGLQSLGEDLSSLASSPMSR